MHPQQIVTKHPGSHSTNRPKRSNRESITGVFGLIIPHFSDAISSTFVPKTRICSQPIMERTVTILWTAYGIMGSTIAVQFVAGRIVCKGPWIVFPIDKFGNRHRYPFSAMSVSFEPQQPQHANDSYAIRLPVFAGGVITVQVFRATGCPQNLVKK